VHARRTAAAAKRPHIFFFFSFFFSSLRARKPKRRKPYALENNKAQYFPKIHVNPRDNNELVAYLRLREALLTPTLLSAFKAVDRARFVPKQLSEMAYLDRPLPIGPGTTISQPCTVAFMLERLQAKPGDTVLDIGAGSGWTTALLAHVVGADGSVTGTELSETLVENANHTLEALGITNARVERAGSALGKLGEHFDRILVSAAAKGGVPIELREQLAVGGRLVAPADESLFLVEQPEPGTYVETEWKGFAFVPLR
jgi:protein-L-isoaspartate(D-aspartate) O-methyltransferase